MVDFRTTNIVVLHDNQLLLFNTCTSKWLLMDVLKSTSKTVLHGPERCTTVVLLPPTVTHYVCLTSLSAGHQDAGDRRVHVCRPVDAVPSLRRLQLVCAADVQGILVLALLPPHGLHEQRHQPDPLQRHVGQVSPSIRASPAVR